jgi:hypothetical protein
VSLKFFLLGGIILLVSGALQVLVRPRNPRAKGLQRWLDASTARALLFVTMGVLALLVGFGVVPLMRMR